MTLRSEPVPAVWRRVPPPPESVAEPLPAYVDAMTTLVQPIVRADDLSVVAYEALSRFPHTDDVERLFQHAHTAGHGDLLEVEALRRALALPDRPDGVDLFVNVSERAIRSQRFWAALADDLTGIMVELHESRAGLDEESVDRILERFRERGARICLDDVGVHAQDLDRIASLHPDVMKIDRRWVDHCDERPGSAGVITSMTEFAKARGVTVCAEGAERPEELEVLRERGCHLVQGFMLGRPEASWMGPVQLSR